MHEKKSLTLKEWADQDKPREKLLSQGKKDLSNAELIAILLRTGIQGKTVLDLAKETLAIAGNSLTTLSRLEYSHLRAIPGMADAKIATLMAALEIGWRMQGETSDKEIIINDSQKLFTYMLPLLADLDHEEFWVIHLNNRKKVIARQRIASGGQTATLVDPRLLFRSALENKAVSIMVAHNHPSGSLKPSAEDRSLTKRLDQAGNLLQIKLQEHIIIAPSVNGQPNYYSFHDNGEI